MVFTRRILKFIGWLRVRKILVIGLIFTLESLIGIIDYVVSDEVPITSLHYLTIALASIIYGWRGAITISLMATISFYVSSYTALNRPVEKLAVPSVGLTFFIFLLVSAGVVLILNLLNSLEISNQTLSDKLIQLQASRAQVELLTSERERLRLARELHDGVAKTLVGVEYNAIALGRMLPPDNLVALERAHFIEKVCHDEAQQLREVILNLRQGYKEPLFELVESYLQRWKIAYNFQTQLTITGSDLNLNPTLVYELMSILEESLENIQRHSQANRVWVSLNITDQVRLQVRDDGIGPTPAVWDYFRQPAPTSQTSLTVPPFKTADGRPHFGLTGMRERAEWLNGQLDFVRAPEGGLQIELELPIKAGSSPDANWLEA